MIVAAHQPLFIPWIGYFDKIKKADLFVIVDNVQFTTSGWIRRNTIKGPQGEQRLTVPLRGKKEGSQMIKDVLIDYKYNPKWREDHLKTMLFCYRKAKGFSEVMPHLEKVYLNEWRGISEFNCALINFVCEFLGITAGKIKNASDLGIQGGKTDLIIDICRKTGADGFMLGMGGSLTYVDRDLLQDEGIAIVEQNFVHPVYPQLFGGFLPRLSVLDLLFNMGHKSKEFVGMP